MSFTAHNVLLNDGTRTWPGHGFIEDHPWLLATLRTLKALFPAGFAGRRLVDLGCLEGGFTAELARSGFDTIGIEVRSSNFANCKIVQAGLALPHLDFVQDDVLNVAAYGPFDVAFCCGILYHLDQPAAFLKTLGAVCSKVVVVNTHFATHEPNRNFPLSELTENEGLAGRWYSEHLGETQPDIDSLKWHSWKNARSFWPLRADLLQAIRDAGFPIVFEQFDFLGPSLAVQIARGSYAQENRGMFVGVKP